MATIEAERTATNAPLELMVNKSGGVTGLTAVVAIRDGDTANSWLDFNDNTFKTSAWTTRQAALAEVSAGNAPGVYRLELDISAITNLPAATDYLVAEYDISGSESGNAIDVITLKANVFDVAAPGDAMDLVTDAVDGAAVAASAVTEIAAGIVTSGPLDVTKVDELHQIHGLESGSDLVVTQTTRAAASISQTIVESPTNTFTVSRP